MKKIVLILMALLLTAGLAACGTTDQGSSSEQASSVVSDAAESASEGTPEALPQKTIETATAEEIAAKMNAMYQGEGEYANLPVATMETSEGTIKIRLFPERAPKTVENFIGLSKKGCYDGVTFHRVMNDFMIQGGDPTASGMGGESFFDAMPFEDEFSDLTHNFRGSLSMANAGYGTNGSQFFIVQNPKAISSPEEEQTMLMEMYMNAEVYAATMRLQAAESTITSQEDMDKLITELNAELSAKEAAGVPAEFAAKMQPVMEKYKTDGGTPFLDYKHTVFGYVFEGMDVVDKIAAVQTGENDKPVSDVVINKITIDEK